LKFSALFDVSGNNLSILKSSDVAVVSTLIEQSSNGSGDEQMSTCKGAPFKTQKCCPVLLMYLPQSHAALKGHITSMNFFKKLSVHCCKILMQ